MRRFLLSGLACALTTLPACGDNGGDTDTEGGSTTTTTTTSTSTTESTTSTSTTEATTEATTEGSTSTTTTTGTPTTTDTGGDNAMEKFGHACEADADCVAVLGDGGKCLKDILGVYGLPGGYCSKFCMLPDMSTAYVPNDPTCGQGVTCIGAMGYFEGCAVECTDNSQCPRTGYECRLMPQIGQPGDPTFCLMTEDNML